MKKLILTLSILGFSAQASAGPVLATVCGLTCGLISTMGCSAGSIALLAVNPAASALYLSSCAYLANAGAISGCTAACLTLPTP